MQSKDDDAGGLAPVKEEDAAMYRLYPLNCRWFFEDCYTSICRRGAGYSRRRFKKTDPPSGGARFCENARTSRRGSRERLFAFPLVFWRRAC